jgi:hypothetical protein
MGDCCVVRNVNEATAALPLVVGYLVPVHDAADAAPTVPAATISDAAIRRRDEGVAMASSFVGNRVPTRYAATRRRSANAMRSCA